MWKRREEDGRWPENIKVPKRTHSSTRSPTTSRSGRCRWTRRRETPGICELPDDGRRTEQRRAAKASERPVLVVEFRPEVHTDMGEARCRLQMPCQCGNHGHGRNPRPSQIRGRLPCECVDAALSFPSKPPLNSLLSPETDRIRSGKLANSRIAPS